MQQIQFTEQLENGFIVNIQQSRKKKRKKVNLACPVMMRITIHGLHCCCLGCRSLRQQQRQQHRQQKRLL
jgi:hypothetical protein